jgi:hypothetical protein
MPCYFGKALTGLINWAVAARKQHPNKRILATKQDVKAAIRRCHLNTSTKFQTCTQLSSKQLTLMMLRLSFGGAYFFVKWGSISESICYLINPILCSNQWDPLTLYSPNHH